MYVSGSLKLTPDYFLPWDCEDGPAAALRVWHHVLFCLSEDHPERFTKTLREAVDDWRAWGGWQSLRACYADGCTALIECPVAVLRTGSSRAAFDTQLDEFEANGKRYVLRNPAQREAFWMIAEAADWVETAEVGKRLKSTASPFRLDQYFRTKGARGYDPPWRLLERSGDGRVRLRPGVQIVGIPT